MSFLVYSGILFFLLSSFFWRCLRMLSPYFLFFPSASMHLSVSCLCIFTLCGCVMVNLCPFYHLTFFFLCRLTLHASRDITRFHPPSTLLYVASNTGIGLLDRTSIPPPASSFPTLFASTRRLRSVLSPCQPTCPDWWRRRRRRETPRIEGRRRRLMFVLHRRRLLPLYH